MCSGVFTDAVKSFESVICAHLHKLLYFYWKVQRFLKGESHFLIGIIMFMCIYLIHQSSIVCINQTNHGEPSCHQVEEPSSYHIILLYKEFVTTWGG